MKKNRHDLLEVALFALAFVCVILAFGLVIVALSKQGGL